VQTQARLEGFVTRYRFVLLFATLLVFFALVPIARQLRQALHPATPPLLEGVVFILVLAAVVVSVSHSRAWKWFTLGLGLPAALLGLLRLSIAADPVVVAHHLFAAAFLAYAVGATLRFIFACGRVTLDTLFASLCVYLLLGVAWALAYSTIDVLDPAAFSSTQRPGEPTPGLRIDQGGTTAALYFSFTTLTTLGYGDIVPVSPIARMLTSVEAITGQLYLTVLVARLVGLHISESLSPGQAADGSGLPLDDAGREDDSLSSPLSRSE
jgi:hypothetical protein